MKFYKESPNSEAEPAPKTESDGNAFDAELPPKQEWEFLGEGGYAKVYKIHLKANDPKRPERKIDTYFALKDYDTFPDDPDPELRTGSIANARQAMDNYTYLKKMGVRVFPTCRISDDQTKILMTLGHNNGWKMFDPNDRTKYFDQMMMVKQRIADKNTRVINRVNNFDLFLQTIKENLELVNRNKVQLPIDCYFFLSKECEKAGDFDLDFVIGDLDCIDMDKLDRRIPSESREKKFVKQNTITTRLSTNQFLQRHIMDKDLKDHYIQKVDAMFPTPTENVAK